MRHLRTTTLGLLLLGATAWAGSELPFDSILLNKIDRTFYEAGAPSPKKIEAYRSLIETRRRQVFTQFLNHELLQKKASPKDARKDAAKESEIEYYDLLLKEVATLEAGKVSDLEFKKAALRAFELDYALKSWGDPLGSEDAIENVVASFKDWYINKTSPIEHEAVNLYNSETGQFYTHDELAQLKAQDKDLSKLDPDPSSTFWNRQPIETQNVRDLYLGGQSALYRGSKPKLPPGNTVWFKSVRRTQSNPKLNVTFQDENGKKVSIKVKLAKEIHAQPTASALSMALGFNSDVSAHVTDLKVVLGKMTYKQFRNEWASYYSKYDPDTYVRRIGKDENGDNYVIFYHALVEAKSDDLLRVGSWPWSDNGHRGLRETRAMILFNMWVFNQDVKESENNKLVLKKQGDSFRAFHLQHDLGVSFGDLALEAPGQFPWNVVESIQKDRIKMNYSVVHFVSDFSHITLSDARWATRLIARLSRQQIADAVAIGLWPESMAKLLVEKLISRRNDLVQAFGLQDEFPELPVDRSLSTPDAVVVLGELKIPRVPNNPTNFDINLWNTIQPILTGARDQFIKAVTSVVTSTTTFEVPSDKIGIESDIITKIRFKTRRDIESNPTAVNEDERYVVRDTLAIGVQLGYGLVAGGKLAYTRTYTLVHTARTHREAKYKGNFVVDLLLPYNVAVGKLPERHVLLVEDSVEGAGTLKLQHLYRHTGIPIGIEGNAGKVMLSRSIVSTKDPAKIMLYKDTSFYNELALKTYVELAFLNLPISKMAVSHGTLNRTMYTVERQKLATTETTEIVSRAVEHGDFERLSEVAEVKQVDSKFLNSVMKLQIFSFLKWESNFRKDRLKISVPSGSTAAHPDEALQVQSYKKSEWNWLDNGEEQQRRVLVSSELGSGDKLVINPSIRLNYTIQDNKTSTEELSRYVRFVNVAAGDPKFIDFDPTLHSLNGTWGTTHTAVSVVYGTRAIRNLLKIERQALFELYLKEFGLTQADFESFTPQDLQRESARLQRHFNAMQGWQFMNSIDAAKREPDASERLVHLARALKEVVWKSGGVLEGRFLGLVNRILGPDDVTVSAVVTIPDDNENKLPGAVPYANQRGPKVEEGEVFYFGSTSPLDLYLSL